MVSGIRLCPAHLPLLTFSSQSYVSCLFNVGMITMHSGLLSAVLHPDLWFRSKLPDLKRSEDLHGTESISKLLGGRCLFGAQQFYCSCLLWKKTHNSWAVFLHSTLQCCYAPNSDVLASAETPAPRYKDWVTLSAGSGYMLLLFFFSSQASTASTAQSTPTSHKNTHTHDHLLSHMSKCESSTRGCQLLPTRAYFFFPPSAVSHHSRFFQLCFWYLYFHRILITLCFSFHVSPLSACPL